LRNRISIFKRRWWLFEWRYWRNKVPWDTNITPPEVMEFLAGARPGRALDLGCGTGTNAMTMAQYGWQVTGLDFSMKAIRAARSKAARAGITIDFQVKDVSDLSELTGLYDYALDIGCLFTLKVADKRRYASGISLLLKRGATYMLYAKMPRQSRGSQWGLTPEAVQSLFLPAFEQKQTVMGEEKGAPSAWYWLLKK
jgi:cyclopropane fatty-acyl-phospholipid synthase-like methyltransferase